MLFLPSLLFENNLKNAGAQKKTPGGHRPLLDQVVGVNKYRLLTPTCCFLDGLVGMAIVGGIGVGVAALAGLVGLAVSKGAAKS